MVWRWVWVAVRWDTDEPDGSAWSAAPEPGFHLTVWQGEHGWRWDAFDSAEPENGLDGVAPDVAAAKAAAEHCYREYRKARPNRA